MEIKTFQLLSKTFAFICSPFTKCVTYLNDEHIESSDNLDIIMNMYNLLEYSDNFAESSGSLWQYKRRQQNMTNA